MRSSGPNVSGLAPLGRRRHLHRCGGESGERVRGSRSRDSPDRRCRGQRPPCHSTLGALTHRRASVALSATRMPLPKLGPSREFFRLLREHFSVKPIDG